MEKTVPEPGGAGLKAPVLLQREEARLNGMGGGQTVHGRGVRGPW